LIENEQNSVILYVSLKLVYFELKWKK